MLIFLQKKIFKEKKIIRFSYKKPFLKKLQWFFTKKKRILQKEKKFTMSLYNCDPINLTMPFIT